MRTRRTTTTLLSLLFLTGPIVLAGCTPSEDEAARIELLARAPERGNWSPQTIRVEKGRPVTIVIRNVDTVTHGFYLPELNLSTGEIKPGEVMEVTFTPEVEGEYTFMCSVWCSDYHMHMRGTLIVE